MLNGLYYAFLYEGKCHLIKYKDSKTEELTLSMSLPAFSEKHTQFCPLVQTGPNSFYSYVFLKGLK